jgi:hypothetical protein
MKPRLVRHIVHAVLRVLCIALPIVLALSAVALIANYEEGRSLMPADRVPGATEPTSN